MPFEDLNLIIEELNRRADAQEREAAKIRSKSRR